jgi:nicotinamidase-related amidase
MPEKIQLLIIDPQVDFCEGGALPVPGAADDMARLAAFIDANSRAIDDIAVTLDSHRTVDVAHPAYWVNSAGAHPSPFTMISAQDVRDGTWTTRNPGWRRRALAYVEALEAAGKYVLMIWPEHCLIGSPGHAVHPVLFAALRRWEEREFGVINYVTKGSNIHTEHYSAVQAEVPDPSDPTTMLNAGLIDRLREFDTILLAGEALSHCVKATVTDIADSIGAEHVGKFVFFEDCSSPVAKVPGGPDFPAIGQQFVLDMKARGMRAASSQSFFSRGAIAA